MYALFNRQFKLECKKKEPSKKTYQHQATLETSCEHLQKYLVFQKCFKQDTRKQASIKSQT